MRIAAVADVALLERLRGLYIHDSESSPLVVQVTQCYSYRNMNFTPNFFSCSSVHQGPLRNLYFSSLVLGAVVLTARVVFSRCAPSSMDSSGGGDGEG